MRKWFFSGVTAYFPIIYAKVIIFDIRGNSKLFFIFKIGKDLSKLYFVTDSRICHSETTFVRVCICWPFLSTIFLMRPIEVIWYYNILEFTRIQVWNFRETLVLKLCGSTDHHNQILDKILMLLKHR